MSKAQETIEQIKELVAGTNPEITINDGVATIHLDQSAYDATLAVNDLTKKQVRAVESHNHAYVDAVTEYAAEQAAPLFKKGKAEQLVVEADYSHRGKVTTIVEKEHTYRNPQTGEKQTRPAVRTAVKSYGAAGTKSFRRNVVEKLAEEIAGS